MSITETLDEAPHLIPLCTGTTQKFPQDIDLCQCPTYGEMSEITVGNSTDCAEYDSDNLSAHDDKKIGSQRSVQQSTSTYRNLKPSSRIQQTPIHERSETIVEESLTRRIETDKTIETDDDGTTSNTTYHQPIPLPEMEEAPELVVDEFAQKSPLDSNVERVVPRMRSFSSFSSSQFSLRRRTSTLDSGCLSYQDHHQQVFHGTDQDSFQRLLGDRKRRSFRPESSSCSSLHPTSTPKIVIGAIVGESNIVDHNNDVQEEETWNEKVFKRTSSTTKQKFRSAVRLVKDIVRCVRYTLIQPWKQLAVRSKPQDEVIFSRAKGRLV